MSKRSRGVRRAAAGLTKLPWVASLKRTGGLRSTAPLSAELEFNWNRNPRYGRSAFSAASESVVAPNRMSWAARKRCGSLICARRSITSSEIRLVANQSVNTTTQRDKHPGRIVDCPNKDILPGAVRALHKAARGHARLHARKSALSSVRSPIALATSSPTRQDGRSAFILRTILRSSDMNTRSPVDPPAAPVDSPVDPPDAPVDSPVDPVDVPREPRSRRSRS